MEKEKQQVLSVSNEKKLRHMLGADGRVPKNRWGYRNYYYTGIGDKADIELLAMEDMGLVVRGAPADGSVYFFATEKGARAVGFKAYQLKNTRLAKVAPMFYLRDTRGDCGSSAMFWKKEGGYGTNLDELEVFTLEDAQKKHSGRSSDVPLLKELVDNESTLAVDCQYIPDDVEADPNGVYVLQRKDVYDGNNIAFVCIPSETRNIYDFDKALIVTEEGARRFIQQATKQKSLGEFFVRSHDAMKRISRKVFDVKNINTRAMITKPGIKYTRPKKRRATSGKVRGNCPDCGKITWGTNPYENEMCKEHSTK